VVEGRVSDFEPNDGGHRGERWAVRGHHYIVNSSIVSSAFNTPGKIQPGDSVRIADVNGAIARLELLK
jgi:hypothetical protein